MNTNAEKVKNNQVKNKDVKRNGFIRVTNKGAFIAQAWVSYMLNGEYCIKTTGELPVLQGNVIIIPANATEIEFEVFIDVFFGWKDIYYTELNQVPTKCYNLYGTTFSAQCVEVPCGSNDNNPNPVLPVIIPPYNCYCPCRCCCNYCCNPQYYNPYISSYNSLGEGYGYNYY
ncbi:hypothetical protein C3495_09335 [Clostridiaceae bacterium 14S0207]|nr:hypothetical protein C3495_09335 [Clostridiaceae bacterium 14S0207]